MAARRHDYRVQVVWTGEGSGTATRGHSRAHRISAPGKPAIEGSSDPAFRGDPARWNPEKLLLASLCACHKLWYLGFCADAGIAVMAYEDTAEGCMVEEPDGAGQFMSVVLRPRVIVAAGSDEAKAEALHRAAHRMCFIARSVNFPAEHRPIIVVEADGSSR